MNRQTERVGVIEKRLGEIDNHFSIKVTKDVRVYRRARDIEPDVYVAMENDHDELLFRFSSDSEGMAIYLHTVYDEQLLF